MQDGKTAFHEFYKLVLPDIWAPNLKTNTKGIKKINTRKQVKYFEVSFLEAMIWGHCWIKITDLIVKGANSGSNLSTL